MVLCGAAAEIHYCGYTFTYSGSLQPSAGKIFMSSLEDIRQFHMSLDDVKVWGVRLYRMPLQSLYRRL